MIKEQTTLFKALLLSQLPMVGNITARKLLAECGSIDAVFETKKSKLLSIEGIGEIVVNNIRHIPEKVYETVEKEMLFIEKQKIHTFLITEEDYPKRLKHCVDAPLLFFGKGTIDFNVARVVAIVGTRKASPYGIAFTKQLIEELAPLDVLVISGLAYGIDTAAHEASVHHNLQTIGVLGHGLHMLYPASNCKLASRMLRKGGLITEFISGTGPDAINFPTRNRIIAGLSDAIIVVEARKEGGALITANLGFSYDRDIFSVPGRVGDLQSEGCNNLIKSNKAALITSAKDVIQLMRWDETPAHKKKRQQKMFFDLSPEEEKVIKVIQEHEEIDIDTLVSKINIPLSRLTTLLLTLECNAYIECLPGKRYKIV